MDNLRNIKGRGKKGGGEEETSNFKTQIYSQPV